MSTYNQENMKHFVEMCALHGVSFDQSDRYNYIDGTDADDETVTLTEIVDVADDYRIAMRTINNSNGEINKVAHKLSKIAYDMDIIPYDIYEYLEDIKLESAISDFKKELSKIECKPEYQIVQNSDYHYGHSSLEQTFDNIFSFTKFSFMKDGIEVKVDIRHNVDDRSWETGSTFKTVGFTYSWKSGRKNRSEFVRIRESSLPKWITDEIDIKNSTNNTFFAMVAIIYILSTDKVHKEKKIC